MVPAYRPPRRVSAALPARAPAGYSATVGPSGPTPLCASEDYSMRPMTRRSFLKGAAAAAAFPLITVAGTKSSGRVLGANDTIRLAVAGIHGRGKDHIDELLKLKDEKLEIVTLIDPDSSLFE